MHAPAVLDAAALLDSARPEPPRRAFGPTFAALDLGTNNCRMLVAAPLGDGFRVLDSFSRIVRLGEGLHGTGRLSVAAMDRAIAALDDCAVRLLRRPVRQVRAIATEACRRATNGLEFLDRVKRETGFDFGIITGREEAELALESCASLLPCDGRRALLFDIGGGSTELAWVRMTNGRPELIGFDSLPMGVVTLSERWGDAGFSPAGFEAMVDDIVDRLRPFERVHCIGREIRNGGVRLLGTSGTVTTLASVVLNLERYRRLAVDGVELTSREASDAVASLHALGRTGLMRHPCVGPERVEFVLPGCAVFAAITRLWPAPHVIVADRGLREGVLLRLMRADKLRQARHDGRRWDPCRL
ncbi:Ppx/GppA phosphatase family protein [Rhodopila sp.]|uniref:Ppx/GppA phosphatase family protein n=1 Tax=Rhodopila sp. TaxID=2480087 RepID=UPI003D0DD6B1